MNFYKKYKKNTNIYLRFSSVAIQMGAIITIFTLLGKYLDNKVQTKYLWTLILSLSSVIISMYLVIKEVINSTKNQENEKK
ncbi:MAG: AtpZ/AtpI family protein [Flavobacteriia bacterium]|nr:AtpZ/AtpI family protein [Flavobacteriia bacterium]